MGVGPEVDDGAGSLKRDAGGRAIRARGQENTARTTDAPRHEGLLPARAPYAVGQPLDVLDTVRKWAEASVYAIDDKRIRITYTYWSAKWDEWLLVDSPRIAPAGSKTYRDGAVPRVGQRVEARDELDNWLEAEVLEVRGDSASVHFKGYHRKFDAQVDVASRIRRFGRSKTGGVDDARSHAAPAAGGRLRTYTSAAPALHGGGAVVDRGAAYSSGSTGGFAGAHSDFARPLPLQSRPGSPRPSSSRSSSSSGSQRSQATLAADTREIADGAIERSSTLERSSGLSERANTLERPSERLRSDSSFARYSASLLSRGLRLFRVAGDGNCLFRAVAHQCYGEDSHHALVRETCMDYFTAERSYFEPYVEGGPAAFDRYVASKRRQGAWGDEPEVQALCELYDVAAEIWACDATNGARILRTFHGADAMRKRPTLRLSYYGSGHYDSVVSDAASSPSGKQPPTRGLLAAADAAAPGRAEARAVRRAKQARSQPKDSIASVTKASDAEATDAFVIAAALAQSRELFDAHDASMEDALHASLRDHASAFEDAPSASAYENDSLQRELDDRAQQAADDADVARALAESLPGGAADDAALARALELSSHAVLAAEDSELLKVRLH
ncbi:hypothetical protein M885DRAFT_519165 [Pelagophyceae sp. CCMP2097]|nr:hypothetical protein M885DRAFT_519165 [Pelagophyceae sp. CCMP2097]